MKDQDVMGKLREKWNGLIDDKLLPVKKLITNGRYNLDSNKFRFQPEKMYHQKRLFTFLGKKMNPFEDNLKDIKTNFADFEKSVRWFSYRENIPRLIGSKDRVFLSDASNFMLSRG